MGTRLMNVAETAEYLRIAKITLYKMTSSRRIPHIKVGKRVMFSQDQIEAWLAEKSVDQIKR